MFPSALIFTIRAETSHTGNFFGAVVFSRYYQSNDKKNNMSLIKIYKVQFIYPNFGPNFPRKLLNKSQVQGPADAQKLRIEQNLTRVLFLKIGLIDKRCHFRNQKRKKFIFLPEYFAHMQRLNPF